MSVKFLLLLGTVAYYTVARPTVTYLFNEC